MTELYREWVVRRCNVAKELLGRRNEGVADAAVILSALISALAADSFPKEKKVGDAQRFVQLLVDPRILPDSPFMRISLVSLSNDAGSLSKSECVDVKDVLREYLKKLPVPENGNSSWIDAGSVDTLCASSVDNILRPVIKPEQRRIKLIRRNSYAHLLYKDLRCSYLHEYRSGERVALAPRLATEGSGSPMASYRTEGGMRHAWLFFNAGQIIDQWIPQIAEKLASYIKSQDKTDQSALMDIPSPDSYWLCG